MKNKKEQSIIRILRKEKGLSQEELAKLIPVNQTAVSQWERGATYPNANAIKRLCQIFEQPSDVFLEIETKVNTSNQKQLQSEIFTEQEKQIIIAYRRKPEMQAAVNKLLGIEVPYTMTVYKIAESENNSPEGYIPMNQSRWEEMDSKPKTDDDLL